MLAEPDWTRVPHTTHHLVRDPILDAICSLARVMEPERDTPESMGVPRGVWEAALMVRAWRMVAMPPPPQRPAQTPFASLEPSRSAAGEVGCMWCDDPVAPVCRCTRTTWGEP